MAESTKGRLFRCLKCENLLSEPEDSPVFQCGGCFTVVCAKIKKREADAVSDKSVEVRAKPISVNSTSSQEKAIADCSETSSVSDAPSNFASFVTPATCFRRQGSSLDRLRKRPTKRCDSEAVINILSTSLYPSDEVTSSSATNFPDSLHEFQKHLKDRSNEPTEQDRAGLLRQLEKLKEQLVQSCNVAGENNGDDFFDAYQQ